MSQGAIGYDLEPGDEPEENDDDDEPDDDDENGDDDGNGDDDEHEEEEPEDRAAPAPRGEPVAAAAIVSIAPPASEPAAAPAVPDPQRITSSRDPRSRFRPLSDTHVAQLAVLDRNSRRLSQLRRPFPEPVERWIALTYGAGKYRLVERDDAGKHIGSKTVTVSGDGQTVPLGALAFQPAAPAEPANGHVNGSAAAPSAPASSVYPGMDWRLALVTTGLPLIAAAMQSFAQAMAARPERSELETLVQAAKILNTSNDERTAMFREGMKLAREVAESSPAPSGEGSPFNLRELLSGLADVVQSFRGQAVAAAPAPEGAPRPGLPPTGKERAAAAVAAAPAKPTAVETPEQFVERVLFTEIQRAVGTADTPECLVILLDAWLPEVAAWIELSSDEQVLEELPRRYPAHAEYLAQPNVTAFLKSALTMIREDAAAVGEEDTGVPREPAAAGA